MSRGWGGRELDGVEVQFGQALEKVGNRAEKGCRQVSISGGPSATTKAASRSVVKRRQSPGEFNAIVSPTAADEHAADNI